MNSLNYFIEANIGITVLYATFQLLLRNETAFKIQRGFMMVGLFIAIVFPFIRVAGPLIVSETTAITKVLPEVVLTPLNGITESTESVWSPLNIVLVFYFTGMTIMLVSMIFQGYRLFRIYRQSEKTKDGSHYIVESTTASSSYSFFNIVVIGQTENLSPEERRMIILHEKCHGSLLHSVDVLIISLATVLFWFNPVIWMYRRTILRIHEYQVDNVVSAESSSGEYSSLLAKTVLMRNGFFLAHPFNQSFILKRINMINKLKSRVGSWKVAALVTVMLALAVLIACTDQVSTSEETVHLPGQSTMPDGVSRRLSELKHLYPDADFEAIKLEGPNANAKWSQPSLSLEYMELSKTSERWVIVRKRVQGSEALETVDEAAQPVNGMTAYYEQLAKVLRYPEQARQQGVEGKVFVEFVVQPDGRLSDYKVLSGIGAGCDAASIEAIAQQENWKPAVKDGKAVAQRMVLPVTFRMQQPKSEVFTKVEQWAEPVNGMTAFYQRVSQELVYPDDARKKGIEGKVFVEVIVNPDGKLSDYEIVKGLDPECDAAAVNALMKMEAWKPAMNSGKAVSQKMVIPIFFKLN